MTNIKEKVLKDMQEKPVYVSENDLLGEKPKDEDGVEINSNDNYYEMVGFENLGKAIDLALAEVGKVIDKDIKDTERVIKDASGKFLEISVAFLDYLKRLKQKLGIK